MDSFNFHDIRVEKAKAISRYRRVQRITNLFRIMELIVFLIIFSRFSTQFAFSLKLSSEHFKGISVTLISPQFVFVLGNAIVMTLFLISRQFSPKNVEKRTDFYEEYVEKCWNEERKAPDDYKYSRSNDERKMHRSLSDNIDKKLHAAAGDERRLELRRCVSEKCRESVECGRKTVGGGGSYSYKEDEMSSEEFRRTVEAFIERQQRFLREEENFSAAMAAADPLVL